MNGRSGPVLQQRTREMGGAPRNPAPRNHFLVWIVKSPGCHCRDALGGKEYRRVPTPLRALPLSLSEAPTGAAREAPSIVPWEALRGAPDEAPQRGSFSGRPQAMHREGASQRQTAGCARARARLGPGRLLLLRQLHLIRRPWCGGAGPAEAERVGTVPGGHEQREHHRDAQDAQHDKAGDVLPM